MDFQGVFFDFDGVILDSVQVKTEAFAAMFSSYGPEVEKQVVAYHLANGGMSRFEKFSYFYQSLLNSSVSPAELTSLCEKFSDLVLEKVIRSPFINGAMEVLTELKKTSTPAFVVSGTPDLEIKLIVKRKNLESYFNEVHGSPRHKEEIVAEILHKTNFSPPRCLFIGDAMSDYDAARITGTNFLGIVPKGGNSPFPAGCLTSPSVALHAQLVK
ncbi:MAG: HAD-IA family hydrolase [Thermodesulfobacteriota bacterium]